jgi:26S proteasome regulatory subunit T1
LTELLKNSFRASVEQHDPRGEGLPLPDIVITLSPPSAVPESVSGAHYFSIRIRDQGGGVRPKDMDRIFSYAFTTAKDGVSKDRQRREQEDDEQESILGVVADRSLRTGMGTIAGLGYGLPMSKLYAKQVCLPFDSDAI